jgi:hypothetical protein
MEAHMRSAVIAGMALIAAALPSFAHDAGPGSTSAAGPSIVAFTPDWPTCISSDSAPTKQKCSLKVLD